MSDGQLTTQQKRRRFLQELLVDGNVVRVCRELGLDRPWMYRQRNKYPQFKQAWDEAVVIGVDALVDEARRRAMGTDEPVFDKDGNEVATRRQYSDVLLMFLIKGHRPEYRDRQQVDVEVGDKLSNLAQRLINAQERMRSSASSSYQAD